MNEKKYKKNEFNASELILSRSNLLIDSMHNYSLLENKLIAYGLATCKIDKNNIPYADINIGIFKKFDGIEATNIYKRVKSMSKTISNHKVIIKNQDVNTGAKTFQSFKLINDVRYVEQRAILHIKFDAKILPLINDPSTPYTTSYIQTLMSFKSNYAYRIYEILSKQEHLLYPKNKEKQQNIPKSVIFRCENLDVLRLQLALIDLDEDVIRYILDNPYNESNECENALREFVSQKSLYKDWYAMKKHTLDAAQKHINNNPLCPINFNYTPIRTGIGGKVTGIEFQIFKNENYILNRQTELEIHKENTFDKTTYTLNYISKVREFIKFPYITDANIMSMLNAANYDIDRIKTAYDLSLQQDLTSYYMHWMLTVIKENEFENLQKYS